ncbi:MAG TPA: ABC transporter ATP-binding protein [Lacunisphaera sp.]|jgi:ABC-2 type transport system ATP-binding protein|nr:ABC transporter ATP-binding protein [Lacunisphaera sp.]
MPPSAPAGLRVRDLRKSYGPVEAVRGVSFDVAPGEIFGLLGLNGAGKTTVIECLLGLREPDAGSVTLGEIDVRRQPQAARRHLGAQLQFASLQDKITPRQALALFGSFYAEAVAPSDLLARFQLTDKAGAAFASLSGGQRQRLFLALAMVNDPSVLVLDEPTAGLDPQSRRELHALIRELRASGRAVLLSTHYLEEAHQLCDRVGILHAGRLLATAAPSDLIARASARPRLFFRAAAAVAAAELSRLPGVTAVQPQADGSCALATNAAARTAGALAHLLTQAGIELLDLRMDRPSLEDVFLELTGSAWTGNDAEAPR